MRPVRRPGLLEAMGLFDLFKRGKAAPSTKLEEVPPAAGLDAIELCLAAFHAGVSPRITAPQGLSRHEDKRVPPENPLDQLWTFDADTHWHYVGLGLSDLFEKTTPGPDSGLGHELTLRVAKRPGEAEPPRWPITVLVNAARAELAGERLAVGQTLGSGPIDGDPRQPADRVPGGGRPGAAAAADQARPGGVPAAGGRRGRRARADPEGRGGGVPGGVGGAAAGESDAGDEGVKGRSPPALSGRTGSDGGAF
ncbi:MAG: suppressor of fused domain protein [Anaeromyxobacter sp.]